MPITISLFQHERVSCPQAVSVLRVVELVQRPADVLGCSGQGNAISAPPGCENNLVLVRQIQAQIIPHGVFADTQLLCRQGNHSAAFPFIRQERQDARHSRKTLVHVADRFGRQHIHIPKAILLWIQFILTPDISIQSLNAFPGRHGQLLAVDHQHFIVVAFQYAEDIIILLPQGVLHLSQAPNLLRHVAASILWMHPTASMSSAL